MNFEQNFSPLDPSSEEYQSIGEEYLQIAPSVSSEGEKRKEEKPITLKDLGKLKTPKVAKEVTLKGIDASSLEDQLIADAKQSQLALEDTYNNVVKGGTNYLNGFIQKIKEDRPEVQPMVSEFLREQASLNKPEQLRQRVENSYEFLSNFTDINDNDNTRNAWINSQYAGAYYSKSNAVKEEYEASPLKDKLSQKQFSGLRSLSYGKKADFNDYINTLQDPNSSQAEKDLVLAKLDKIASNIDIAAGSAMGKEGNVNGIELFNSGTSGAKEAEERMIQIEYDNPFTIQSFKDIVGRATERGLYSAESADILTVTSENTGIPVERLAEINRLQQEARQSKAYEEFQKDMSFENFMKNPLGIMAELTLESLVAMYKHGASRMAAGAAEGAALGSVIPGFGTITGASTGFIAGSGLTSLNLEHSSKIMETLSEEGVDITNANSLRDAFGNEELMDRARKAGWKKGVPVALFDMLSAGIAGKFVSKSAKAIMTTGAPSIGRKIGAGFAELGAQSTLGGVGEGVGEFVEKGKIYDTNAIVMEMLGETFGSAGEIVTGRAFEIAKKNEPLKTKDLVSIVSKNDIGFINNNIDVHLGAGLLTEEQANVMKSQVAYAKGMMNKLPAGMSVEGSANIIDLIGQRNQVLSNAETLDDVFKKKANAEAKQIDEQILNIFNSEQDAIKESARQEQIRTEQGGIRQYQGTQPVQDQTTNEAKDSNRPIGSQAQFQVGQQDVGVYKKETSAIANKMNEIGGAAVEFTADASVNSTSKSNVSTLSGREGIVKQPNTVSITDFNGIPMMLTISDELTTGSIVNPATGNVISNLNGGVGFNYSEGNTDLAWAYTDKETATDTLNYAKDIYQKNKELFDKLWSEGKLPQNHIPVAVVKMGTEAINSNEAVFRVFLDNLQSLPKQNLKAAYSELVKDIEANYNRLNELSKRKTLSPSERNALNGYAQIKNEYLKKNKSILDVVSNVAELNINTRPLITDRISSGEVGLLPAENRLKADKPVTKALMQGLPKSDIKKIHLGYIAEPLRDSAIKDVPARHIISFVGIDVSKNEPVKTGNHKNYPFALAGQGLGVVENTAHISSVMPTAYGNIVSKITDAVAKDGSITPSQAVSRALPSGLSNFIFRNKTLATNDNLSKLIGFLNLSFPDVTFFTDKQSFEDVLSSEGVKEYLKDGDIIYGVTKDGNIYLNPEKATYNTAIHEMGHIWVDFIENTKPELFAQGLKLVEGTAEFEAAKARLGDTVFARKEALAMLIGNKGETIADAAMKSQFKEWLVGVWKYLQELFPNLRKLTPQQIENLSLSDFLGGALQDILSGKPISTQKSEYTATESQFQRDIVPTGGVPSVPGETGIEKTEGKSGLPEKKKYSWEKGAKERPQIGETMIKTSTGRYVGVESMKSQLNERQKTLREMAKGAKSFFKKVSTITKTVLIDNQSGILSALSDIGRQGQLVKAYLLTRNGASSTAVILAEEGVKRVYGNVTRRKVFDINGAKINEYQLLNQIIAFRRVVSIQQRMEEAYDNMYSEWLKIKPLYESINNIKKNIKSLSDIISSDDFKRLNKEEKTAVTNRLNGLKAELELLSEQFDKESVDFNRSKKVLLDNNMIDEKAQNITAKLEVEFAMGQLTASQARASLYETREAIGEEAFDKLMKNSDEYSNHFNEMLKSRMEAGLISKEVYDDLSKYYYAPTKYIEQFLTSAMLSVASKSTSYVKDATLLKKLAGGSESLNNNDYEGLLRAVTYASEHSISENRATARFYDLVASNIDNFEKNGIRLGTILEPIEASSDAKFDIIDKKLNLITSEGEQEKLQYKGISKAETGIQKAGIMEMAPYQEPIDVIIGDDGKKYRIVQQPLGRNEDYIKTYSNGRRLDIIVPDWFADEWYNRNMVSNRYYNDATSILGKITGANALRVIATGVNPIFGIVQLIPDTTSAYAATIEQRRSVTGLFLIEYPIFFAKTLIASNDIFRNTEDYKEALKYGATTNFYNGGSISFEKGITGEDSRSIESVVAVWQDKSPVVARQALAGLKYLMIGTKKITETTEQLTKVALFKEVRDNKIKKFKKENGRNPDAQELEDIKIESAAIARSTADFHRKGVLGSGMNKVFPYLNAGVQIDRATTNAALKTPLKFAYNALSFVGVAGLLTAYALGKFDDDDELVAKKREAYFRLSEKDRDTRLIMEYIDSEDRFISIKLPSFLVPIQSLSRRATEKYYLNNETLDYKDLEEITKQVIEATPVGQYKTLSSRNPGYSMYQKYFENYDSYRKEQVVQNEKGIFDYQEGTKAGTRRASAIAQKIGQLTKDGIPFFPEGISPKRLDAVANTIPFSSNPFTSIPLFFVEKGTSSKDLFEERYGKTAMSNIMKISGISDRFLKQGSKINQGIVDIPEEKAKERTSATYAFADVIMNKYDSLLKENESKEDKLNNMQIAKKAKEWFIKNEYKKLDPREKTIAKSYIQSEFKSIAKKGGVEPDILQIVNISSPSAKLESILETLRTIKTTDESKKKFIEDLYNAGITKSKAFQRELNIGGLVVLSSGAKNKYYNPEVGFIRKEFARLTELDR